VLSAALAAEQSDAEELSIVQIADRPGRLTAAMTGMRQGELLALRRMDVDWMAHRVRVRRNFVRGKFGTPKSKRSSRSIPLADEVARELDLLFQGSSYQTDEDLVYDLIMDPGEMRNLAELGRLADLSNQLHRRLRGWMARTSDPLLDGPVPSPAGHRSMIPP
jgi:integrase